MKVRWIPFLATTACLALAIAAPAQDRGRRGGGGGDRSSRSSDRGSSDRGSSDRSSRGAAPVQREQREYRSSRSSRDYGDSRPDRGARVDPSSWPSADRGRGTRPQENRPSDNRPSGGFPENRPGRGDDSRPNRIGDDSRPSRSNGDRSDRGDRRNPFERSTGGFPQDRGRPDGFPSRGSNDRFGGGDRPGRLDGGRFERSRGSRSGRVAYGTSYNGFGSVRPTRYGGGFNRATLGYNVRRGRPSGVNFVFGGVYGGLRYGYVGFNNFWQDDNFCYPFYVFDPWAPGANFVASPWYRYSYLPPYLNTSRVTVVNNYYSSYDESGDWRDYDTRAEDRDRRNEALDDALADIRDAFERNGERYAERIVPQSGQVAIFNDGKYDYSLGADDFRDMFLDGVAQSKTTRYEVLETRTKGDEVHLRARHEYTDSWGESQVAYHTYTLRRESGNRFVIREFGTD